LIADEAAVDDKDGEGAEKVEIMEVKAITYYQSEENYMFLFCLNTYDFFIVVKSAAEINELDQNK